MIKFNKRQWISISIATIIGCGLIVGNYYATINAGAITNLLCGEAADFDNDDAKRALEKGDAITRNVGDESIVLLKNNNNLLPLQTSENQKKKVNLFGWSSTNGGFILIGAGSGGARLNAVEPTRLVDSLKNANFEVNEELISKYEQFASGYPRTSTINEKEFTTLVQPKKEWYTSEIMNQAKEFSDTAIVTISRYSSENIEMPLCQYKSTGETDTTRTYLQISKEEEDMLNLVCDNFKNVIVLINSGNTMELGFLNNDKISAALDVGYLGQSGANGIGRILAGIINPSGHVADTYAYDHKTAPSFANVFKNSNQITYTEDIYIGYKWYETADVEGYWNEINNNYGKGYDGVVQYPFGYGLSYTTFKWEVQNFNLDNEKTISKYMSFILDVKVTNTGNVEGKDVVQLYYTAPYTKGEVEKASRNLLSFGKTKLLQPNESDVVRLKFDLYDLASYDCYDKNNNGKNTYELDAGTYHLNLMTNSHNLKNCDRNDLTFSLAGDISYKMDPKTKQIVKNRFTGDTAYANCPIDGSTTGEKINYLSRSDFKNTFPKSQTPNRDTALIKDVFKYRFEGYNNNETYKVVPTMGKDNGLRIWTREDGTYANIDDLNGTSGVTLKLNKDLVKDLGTNYNSPTWKEFLDQITKDELFNLVEASGYGNDAIVSIGKANNKDSDGPSGIHYSYGSFVDPGSWTSFAGPINFGRAFNKELSYDFGKALGYEALATGISGVYAPGVNLHRTPYNGRNFEYFSEDGVLSGYLAAETIKGARTENCYLYLKHFAASEEGINPGQLNKWLTEQNLREVYLKPFEIAVKKGGANAMMTCFNRIGTIWAGGNRALLTNILRTEWGFKGVVITDWSQGNIFMDPTQGLLAGNDMWLNPNDSVENPIDRNNPIMINLARNAVHNMVYTLCNTYANAETDAVVRKVDKVFAWWIPVLASVDVLIVAGLGFMVFFAFKPKKKISLVSSENQVEINGLTVEKEKVEDNKKEKSKKLDKYELINQRIDKLEDKLIELINLIKK